MGPSRRRALWRESCAAGRERRPDRADKQRRSIGIEQFGLRLVSEQVWLRRSCHCQKDIQRSRSIRSTIIRRTRLAFILLRAHRIASQNCHPRIILTAVMKSPLGRSFLSGGNINNGRSIPLNSSSPPSCPASLRSCTCTSSRGVLN